MEIDIGQAIGADLTRTILKSDGSGTGDTQPDYGGADDPAAWSQISLKQGDVVAITWTISLRDPVAGDFSVMARLSNDWAVVVTAQAGTGNRKELNVKPVLSGDELELEIPLADLDGLSPPFEWRVMSMWVLRGPDEKPSEMSTLIDSLPGNGLADMEKPGMVVVPRRMSRSKKAAVSAVPPGLSGQGV